MVLKQIDKCTVGDHPREILRMQTAVLNCRYTKSYCERVPRIPNKQKKPCRLV